MSDAKTLEDYSFSTGDAGASFVYNEEAGQIRVGGFICMGTNHDKPCKVTSVSTSKTGKHGHAKCNFVAIDIFTGKKYEDIIPSTHTAHVPFVTRAEYTLVDITEESYCVLMTDTGETREDIKLPDWPSDFAREIKGLFESSKTYGVEVLTAMGHDQIVKIREEAEAK